jgi:hypothetical protein
VEATVAVEATVEEEAMEEEVTAAETTEVDIMAEDPEVDLHQGHPVTTDPVTSDPVTANQHQGDPEIATLTLHLLLGGSHYSSRT